MKKKHRFEEYLEMKEWLEKQGIKFVKSKEPLEGYSPAKQLKKLFKEIKDEKET